jgi:hypothetical protein
MQKQTKSGTPLGVFNSAHAYLFDAAMLYMAARRPRNWHYEAPVRLLYFHAIELFLKVYLRITGLTEDELSKRSYGHDLKRLIDEAEARCMPVTKCIDLVRIFHEAEEARDRPIDTRYLKTGTFSKLKIIHLDEATRDLQSIVRGALHAAGCATQRLPRVPIVHPQQRRTVRYHIRPRRT